MNEDVQGTAVVLKADNIDLASPSGARLCWMGSLEALSRGGRFFIRIDRALNADEMATMQVLAIPVAALSPEESVGKNLILSQDDDPLAQYADILLAGLIPDPDSPCPDSVLQILSVGILPKALINALTLTAWQSQLSHQVYTRDQIRALYRPGALRLEKASLSYDRLLEINAVHLRRMPPRDLMPFVREALAGAFPEALDRSDGWMAWATQLLQGRMTLIAAAPEVGRFLFSLTPREYTTEALGVLGHGSSQVILKILSEALADMTHFNGEENRKMLKGVRAALKSQHGITGKIIDRVIESALIGQLAGYPLADVITLLGKDTCADRITQAISIEGNC